MIGPVARLNTKLFLLFPNILFAGKEVLPCRELQGAGGRQKECDRKASCDNLALPLA
jgi:hypothetical protein